VRPLPVAFVAGPTGPWAVARAETIAGAALPSAAGLTVLEGSAATAGAPPGAAWVLRGVTSNERYVTRREHDALAARQAPLGRPAATRAALIPITKSEAWWDLAQDERRRILEDRARHIATGLEYLPAIARRLHHGRDLGEPFDFLTWFEFAPADATAFDELVARLRATEEWRYVEREIDIRLVRSDQPAIASHDATRVSAPRRQRSVPVRRGTARTVAARAGPLRPRGSAVDRRADLLEVHHALDEDEHTALMERHDVGLRGRLVEPGLAQHLLEIVVRGDTHALDVAGVRGDGLAVGVGEAAAAAVLGVAGERAHRLPRGVRGAGVGADDLGVRGRRPGVGADGSIAGVVLGVAHEDADLRAGDAGGPEPVHGVVCVLLGGVRAAERGHVRSFRW
jgi:hypothetical protein